MQHKALSSLKFCLQITESQVARATPGQDPAGMGDKKPENGRHSA